MMKKNLFTSYLIPHTSYLKFKKRFTLIELLVVIAVIAILASMMLPTLGKTKNTVQRVTCLSNMRQYAACLQQYAEDNGEWGPKIAAGNNDELLYYHPDSTCSVLNWLPPAELKRGESRTRIGITVCPTVTNASPAAAPGNAINYSATFGYLVTSYDNAFGWVDFENNWYGFPNKSSSIYGQVPRLTMLGKGEQTLNGKKRTLKGPSVQPMCGDRFVIDRIDGFSSGPYITSNKKWLLGHRGLGTNTMYFDGHGKWWDLSEMRNRKIAKTVPFYDDRCVPLDL